MTLEDALVYTAEAMGGRLSAPAIEMMVSDLAGCSQDEIFAALKRCRAECKGRLALADIIERMPSRPPTADEAWQKALEARLWDDDATIAVANAVLRAFPFAMWTTGDKVGARRAFIDAYRREAAKPDAFDIYVSDGFDREARVAALNEAVHSGVLPPPDPDRKKTDGSELLLSPPEEDPPMSRETGERRFGELLADLRAAKERRRDEAYQRIQTRKEQRRIRREGAA